jgi:hypothetical protein
MNRPKAKPTPTFTLEEIGPSIAAKYLEHNDSNRVIRRGHILQLAEQMSKGLWMPTDQGIGFDWDGVLTNGQHRLLAIIESGVTIQIMVARNLNPKAKKVTDRDQVSRSAADVFFMAGVATNIKCQTIQAAINVMHRFGYDGRYRNRKDRLYQDMYDTYLLHYPYLTRWVDWAHRIGSPPGMQKGTMAGLGVVFQLAAEEAGVEADAFMDQVASGLGLEEGSPIVLLRERAMKSSYNKEFRLTPYMIGWLLIKAWNAVADGKTVKQLHIRSDENPPFVIGFDATQLPYYAQPHRSIRAG